MSDPHRIEIPRRPAARPLVWLAHGFGLGLSPFASGTAGSLWGVALVAALWPRLLPNPTAQAALAAALSLLAVPICGAGEGHFGRKDDGRIVADEYLTFPLAFIGLPIGGESWWLLPVGFVVVRFMDIVKPWPARRLQELPGGWGVTVDDVVASLYALGVNHLIFRLSGVVRG